MRALPADRQTAAVPQAAIAAEIHQPLDIHRDIAPEIALDHVVAVDHLADLQHFLISELRDPARLRNAHLGHDLLGLVWPDAVDVLQRDHDALVGRNIYAGDAGHVVLLLSPDAAGFAFLSFKNDMSSRRRDPSWREAASVG